MTYSQQQQAKISNSKIAKDLAPFSQTQAARQGSYSTDSRGMEASKFHTSCSREHAASLKCISDNYEQKGVCQQFFNAYKKCKKEEHTKLLEERSKNPKPLF